MQDNPISPQTPTPWDTLRALYLLMVLSDLAIDWFRLSVNFQRGGLIFHLLETPLKLAILVFALQKRRWAYVVQILLSALALLSSFKLVGQPNHRAANDPLLWISLGAQVFAGICCAFWLPRRKQQSAP